MTIEKIVCDECGRVKAEANHWHQMAVMGPVERLEIHLGYLGTDPYSVHDLCGEQCFHKHIAKLLGFNEPPLFSKTGGVDPANAPESTDKTLAEANA